MDTYDVEPPRLSSVTQKQLHEHRINDFLKYLGLAAYFADSPHSESLALRNFASRYPNATHASFFQKAAVSAATTLDSTWASPLSPVSQIRDAVLEMVRAASLLGKIPGLRKVPSQSSLPWQSGGGSYGWTGEGAPAPVSAAAFTPASLPRAKVSGIMVASKELLEMATVDALAVVKRELVEGSARFLDTQFVDPTIAAVADVSPASITNSAGTSASAGSSAANALVDLQTLFSAFTAAHGDTASLVLLMRPSNAIAIAKATNSATLTINGGFLWGVPVFTSTAVGTNLILLDASKILVSDEDAFDISVSQSGSVQMDSAPDAVTSASTVLVSFFQRNLVGVRLTRFINWSRPDSTSVRYISGAAYA